MHIRYALISCCVFMWFMDTSIANAQSSTVFVHTDKTIYTPNEVIWFTGYLLNERNPHAQTHTFFVNLIDVSIGKVVKASRYVVDHGISMGAFSLPDSISAGEYILKCFSDEEFKLHGDNPFMQWISIRINEKTIGNLKPEIDIVNHFKDSTSTRSVNVRIKSDFSIYSKRSKTSWQIKITDTSGVPVFGVFSVSCVLSKRITSNQQDILDFYNQNQPRDSTCDRDMTGSSPLNAIATFRGQILKGKNRPKSPVRLLLFNQSAMKVILTDSSGGFSVSPDLLIGNPGARVVLSIADKNQQANHRILFDVIDTLSGQTDPPLFPEKFVSLSEPFSLEEKNTQDIKLREVNIKSNAQVDNYGFTRTVVDSSCNAWVCWRGHWKCDVSKPSTVPTPGVKYYDIRRGIYVLYNGCPDDKIIKPFIKTIEPTCLPLIFLDYAKNKSAEPNYSSTIYWNYLISTDERGEAGFSFYTGDLPGRFTCRIQGISRNGPLSAEATIQIK